MNVEIDGRATINSGKIVDEWIYDFQNDPEEQAPIKNENYTARGIMKQSREYSAVRLGTAERSHKNNFFSKTSAEINERLEELGYK